MPYSQVTIDTFNGSAIDFTDRWTSVQGSGIPSQSAGSLNMPCVMDYPMLRGKNYFHLGTGILAARLTATGTRTDASEFYIGAQDSNGNGIAAEGSPVGAYITFEPSGLATFSNEVKSDTTIGIGPSWANGDWWGIGNVASDNILKMYKSKNGQEWTEMARCTVGGTFDRTSVSVTFKTGIWNGTTTNLVAKFDDVSFWRKTQLSSRMIRSRIQSALTWAEPMVWDGSEWVSSTPKVMDEDLWRPAL